MKPWAQKPLELFAKSREENEHSSECNAATTLPAWVAAIAITANIERTLPNSIVVPLYMGVGG